ncbi:MAG: alpha/beta fold hydrolase [Hyphomonadaceae bacterium]|nr:alpha/beta fold hydrolase [Hyphomonadaceae bacterium]
MSTLALRRQTPPAIYEDVSVPLTREFRLQSGDTLEDGVVRVRLFGARNAPQLIALGGISAGREVLGENGWWSEVLEPAVDLQRFGVIGFDFAPIRDVRVRISPDDQARIILHALDRLDVTRVQAFLGASYGGMIGLALAALAPERIARLCVISAAHRPAAQALGWRGVQRRIVEFALAHGEGAAGLSLARQLAMITYRSAEELETRFGSGVDEEGLGALDRYLIARGDAYIDTVSPRRWLSLSASIDRFSIDPAAVTVPTTLIACPTDQLVPFALIEEMSQRLPRLQALHAVPSLYGHDAFLKEATTIASLLRGLIESSLS